MPRQRLSTLLAPSTKSSTASTNQRDLAYLLSALRSGAPGQWSQSLLELSRHFTSAAFLAINTLAKQAGGSRFEVFERTTEERAPNGKLTLSWEDPIHKVFENPNTEDTWHDLVYQTVQQKAITGIALTWKPAMADRDVKELYNIPSALAWPMPPSAEFPRGSYRMIPYPYGAYGTTQAGQTSAGATIPAEQVIRIKNHHPLFKHDGYAVLTAASMQIDTLEAIDKSRFNTQQLGCDQTLALKLDRDCSLPDEAELTRLRVQLQALYAGPANAGKLFIAPPGSEISNISTSPKEMAFQEGWKQMLDFVLACYGTPAVVCGLMDNVNYATLYAALRAFHYLSLGPELGQVASHWTKKLIHPTWGREYGIAIFAPEYRDEALEEQKLSNDLKCGAVLNREVRKMHGRDHLDQPWVNERAWASQPSAPGGKEPGPRNGDQEEDPDVNNARPGKDMSSPSHQAGEGLLAALERGKSNGTLHPIRN